MDCPKCNFKNPEDANFCMKCATPLLTKDEPGTKNKTFSGERKHATVMFSDLSGYTAMTEKLDPEEVKNLMGDIFKKAESIVKKFGGTVERFFGDEVMVLFGVPKAHEDDPVRAIHAALEIHKLVENLSPAFEKAHQTPLKMHTGINTGLVITGDEYIGKGRHGLTGDTINLAKRLTSVARPGQIILGPGTHKLVASDFQCTGLDPVSVKGKKDPVQVFRVTDHTDKTDSTQQLKGIRADLIGRGPEIETFRRAVEDLKTGQGSVLSIFGFAGTGKSRLVEEFKKEKGVSWYEGFSYPYTSNTPYFPLITLFNSAFGIKDEDSSDTIRTKIETGINALLTDRTDISQYICSLYSLSDTNVDSVSPEYWKSKLFEAVLAILEEISKNQPTIICFEDLHWADPSSLELIRYIQSKTAKPILFINVARPVIQIYSKNQIEKLLLNYREIEVEDLSGADSQIMLVSLLKSKDIPTGLKKFVEEKTQGNPFYLEEMINSLIESNVLIKDGNQWHLKREIAESDISSTIHGVISARIDRLEIQSRRILQEASVVGRSFYFEIINRITEINRDIHSCLNTLESFDLIKEEKSSIDVEYMFKHALTQEVVYKGLLKTDREIIHEKIGRVIEEVFSDRLAEFYETLAHHFSKGASKVKAVDYLMKSGDKSIKRYSVNEADTYFQKAYDLAPSLPGRPEKTNGIIIDLINRWALVKYYKGDYKSLESLLSSNSHLIENLQNQELKGMYFAWQGNVEWVRARYKNARALLEKAEQLGEEIGSPKIIGYACTWLTWVWAEMGNFEKGLAYGSKAVEIGEAYKEDHYIYLKSMGGIAYNYFWMNLPEKCMKAGQKALQYGQKYSQVRSIAMGHGFIGGGYLCAGDFSRSEAKINQALDAAADPMYSFSFETMQGRCLLQAGKMEKASETTHKVMSFTEKYGLDIYGDLARMFMGVLLIDSGKMQKGFDQLVNIEKKFQHQKRKGLLPAVKLIFGKVYLEIIQQTKPVGWLTLLKNAGFVLKNTPFAYKKAQAYFTQTIEMADTMNAVGTSAQAHLDLGILHKIKNNPPEAEKHLKAAIDIFKNIGADKYLEKARLELYSIKK